MPAMQSLVILTSDISQGPCSAGCIHTSAILLPVDNVQHANTPELVIHHEMTGSALQLMEAHARATRLPHKLSPSPPVESPQPEDTLDTAEGARLLPVGCHALTSGMH